MVWYATVNGIGITILHTYKNDPTYKLCTKNVKICEII